MAGLAGHRNCFFVFLLDPLVAAEAALVSFLGMKGLVKTLLPLFTGLIMATRGSTTLHSVLSVPGVVAGSTFNLDFFVSGMGKADKCFGLFHSLWRPEP